MAKFRLRLKLQGLEVEIDGEREDLPAIRAAVQQQIAGIVEPIEIAADGRKQVGPGSDEVLEAETTKTRGAQLSAVKRIYRQCTDPANRIPA